MKLYVGYRGNRNTNVFVNKLGDVTTLDPGPSQAIVNHSPDGFEWAYNGSGPAQLALALLLDTSHDEALAQYLHQEFKDEFVTGWGDRWFISEKEIDRWIKDKVAAMSDTDRDYLGYLKEMAAIKAGG